MSDKKRDDAEQAELELRFGEKLKSTRETMGISVQDAASRLHLSPRFINMLENDNLLQTELPLIYLRGYLRSYTRLLNISEKELAPLLERLDPAPEITQDPVPAAASETLSLTFPLGNNPYFARIATTLISLGLLISITTWWYSHGSTPSTTTEVEALNQSVTTPEAAPTVAQAPSQETTLAFNNTALDNTPAKSASPEQTEMPAPSINLVKAPLSIAAAQPIAGHNASDEENTDEQD